MNQRAAPTVNLDVFSSILSHISSPRTIHAVLQAIPRANPLFHAALTRRVALPIQFDVYDQETEAASTDLLDVLLRAAQAERLPSIRHLSLAIEVDLDSRVPLRSWVQDREKVIQEDFSPDAQALFGALPTLVRACPGLRRLHYYSFPGLALPRAVVDELAKLEQLEHVTVDCSVTSSQGRVSGGGDYAEPGQLSAEWDGDIWDIEPFASTVGPKLTSLNLRHINLTFYNTLIRQTEVFATYHKLRHLTTDIIDGVWDWRGGGSPVEGASPEFNFQHLGFPAVEVFDLVVTDLTLSGPKLGPLKMVSCERLTELHILVQYSLCFGGDRAVWDEIKLFEALTGDMLPALRLLEVKDNAYNQRYYWIDDPHSTRHQMIYQRGRAYPGFVPCFLASIGTGALPNLTHLWVDEKILIGPTKTLIEFSRSTKPDDLAWMATLRTAFARLVSVRVGFGPLDATSIDIVLNLLNPAILRDFGFEWDWHAFGRQDPLSPKLIAGLTRFPHLTDVHFLFPRPTSPRPPAGERTTELPYPPSDPYTLAGVSAIFDAHSRVSRVGVGNSILWERHVQGPLLVSDGKNGPNANVPRFFRAGYMYAKDSENADNYSPLRPVYREEINEMRELLKRILV
ncbi:hypothetical protein HMN09_00295700 [Mycena chlorophos]|uniref:Uncharacterized protein n=1 Tax=Mycena chlorophos TaxID=658473 RepID=A0A8H6WJS5_MYCCL|nr:hypothetical protein HMN09_00295700 [Mycena chlorophos]